MYHTKIACNKKEIKLATVIQKNKRKEKKESTNGSIMLVEILQAFNTVILVTVERTCLLTTISFCKGPKTFDYSNKKQKN